MTDVEIRLKQTAEAVDARMKELLKTPDPSLEALYSAMRYSALTGGKRIRPHLVLEFCRLFGGSDDAALDFACAVEFVHSSSLIHDDMPAMDDDDYRRGKPTCHKVFGEGIALLAGDTLIVKGFETAAGNKNVPSDAALAAAKLIAQYAGGEGMMGGQNIDLCSENKQIPFDEMLKMHAMKTGALIRLSALLGCVAACVGEKDARYKDAEDYARGVGATFQIIDDVLDVTGDEKTLGKSVHADEKEHKTTFLSFLGISEALEFAANQTRRAISSIEKYEGSGHLVALAEFLLGRKK